MASKSRWTPSDTSSARCSGCRTSPPALTFSACPARHAAAKIPPPVFKYVSTTAPRETSRSHHEV